MKLLKQEELEEAFNLRSSFSVAREAATAARLQATAAVKSATED